MKIELTDIELAIVLRSIAESRYECKRRAGADGGHCYACEALKSTGKSIAEQVNTNVEQHVARGEE